MQQKCVGCHIRSTCFPWICSTKARRGLHEEEKHTNLRSDELIWWSFGNQNPPEHPVNLAECGWLFHRSQGGILWPVSREWTSSANPCWSPWWFIEAWHHNEWLIQSSTTSVHVLAPYTNQTDSSYLFSVQTLRTNSQLVFAKCSFRVCGSHQALRKLLYNHVTHTLWKERSGKVGVRCILQWEIVSYPGLWDL